MTTLLLVIYLAGVGLGLVMTDDRWPARLVVPLLWPVGPAAFVSVVTGLTIVAACLWPFRVLPVLIVLGVVAYMLL